jgi:hypothetical protein
MFRGARQRLAPAVFIAAALALFVSAPAQAQGLGLSGNFYRQHYELAPGESLPTGDVYVVVSNSGDSPLVVNMVTDTPPGVTLSLSEESFTLALGAKQQVYVGVQVSEQASPGEYTLAISAEAQRQGTGIKITTGTQQQAKLSVLGESGRVIITAVTETKEPFPALVGIYQETNDGLAELRPPQTGSLEARLAPGDYVIQASYQDIKLAEEGFSLADGEEKDITLVCPTLLLSDFSVSPVNTDEGKLASARIGYTIANLAKPLADVRAVLRVTLDGQPLDETELASFSLLDPGSREGSATYIPAQGWQDDHTYGFTMGLYAGDSLRYESPTEKLVVGEPSQSAATSSGASASNNRPVIIGAIAGTAATVGAVLGIRRRRRRY